MKPVRITSQAVEKSIKAQRDLDVRRQELASFGKENSNLISAANAQTKIELQRRLNQQQICRTENQYEENLKQKKLEDSFRNLTLSQNQALASELEKDVADEERRKRDIQKICEESPELKELEKMLRIAYLNKERAAQYEEKILLATREQERIQAMEDQMEYERLKAIHSESSKEEAKKSLYKNQRVVLQKQIDEKNLQLLEAKRAVEIEKEKVDEIIKKINMEDENDYRSRKEKQAATALMVRNFELERKRALDASRAALKAEEDRILSYNKLMDSRSENVAAKKQAKKEEEDRVLQKIVEETERKRREEEEFNSLRDMLWEEELEAKRIMDSENKKQKQSYMREEMMNANSKMLISKKLQRQQEAEEEARLVQTMRQKFAEDEARERIEEENRKNSKLHHMSLIEKQKFDRKVMYDEERSNEVYMNKLANDKEEYRKKVIQEARKRLLQDHASKLAGYVPTKAFANQDEFEIFQKSTMGGGGRY